MKTRDANYKLESFFYRSPRASHSKIFNNMAMMNNGGGGDRKK